MKKVKFTKYLNHPELTGDVQYIPDEVAEFKDAVAEVIVNTDHAIYVEEPKKPKPVKITKNKIFIVED